MASPSNAHLVSACSDILLSPACMRIGFKWRNQHITALGYRAVIFALIEGRIGVRYKAGLTPNNPAQYGYRSNTLYLSSNFNQWDPLSRISVVHEATHAIQDVLFNGWRIRTENEEGAAYFAGSLFNAYSPPGLQYPRSKMKRKIWKVAFDAALAYGGHPGGSVSEATISAFISAFSADPDARREMAQTPFVNQDGVPASVWP